LLAVWDLARTPWLTFTLLALAFGLWFRAVRRLEHRLNATQVLLVATLLRLLLIPLPPSLSEDILRYTWDGRVLTAGHNPYLLAPESPQLAELRDDLWQEIPHKEVETVYPPVALALFGLSSILPLPLLSLKILLCVAELAACWLLIRLAANLGLNSGRTAWYAWNPLVAMEVAGMGHIDGLGVLPIVATAWLLSRSRPAVLTGLTAAAGVLTKLVPLVALPLWALISRRPAIFLLTALLPVLGTLGAVAASTDGVPPGLVRYSVSWEFNGPLYEPLWRGLERIEADRRIKGGLDRLKLLTGRHQQISRLYPWVYPQLLAKGLLALLLLGLLGHALWGSGLVAGSGRTFAAVLICTATLYPWYLLWVLPWAALARHRAWLMLSALVQLSYLPQITEIEFFPWLWLVIWAPFFISLQSSKWSAA